MSKRRPRYQAVIEIIKKDLVWPELGDSPEAIHYYHLTDSLGRKWQTIGCHVTDAIKVFRMGDYRPWTYILGSAPYDPNLTFQELVQMLHIRFKDRDLKNDMQIILNSPARCNQFVDKIVNVNHFSVFKLLYELKNEYLVHEPMSESSFESMYSVNPIEALSHFYLENMDTLDYWEWKRAGGTAELAISYRKGNPELSLIEAIEKAERSRAKQ
ncbi:hypothetical protein [Paenibacillus zanthoxyli]|uniref:hypothetical protein n=1 Tax=Paenibacillus zanthoxyli TaxID=369399 RepID=UPI0004701BEC|nr:hypothetical protein [Paenibacillus zanthoxyli]